MLSFFERNKSSLPFLWLLVLSGIQRTRLSNMFRGLLKIHFPSFLAFGVRGKEGDRAQPAVLTQRGLQADGGWQEGCLVETSLPPTHCAVRLSFQHALALVLCCQCRWPCGSIVTAWLEVGERSIPGELSQPIHAFLCQPHGRQTHCLLPTGDRVDMVSLH